MRVFNSKTKYLSLTCIAVVSLAAQAESELASCVPACRTDEICIRVEPAKPAVCRPRPPTAPLANLRLPFREGVKAYCTHSSGSGSHSWINAYFALDLASPYEEAPATIVAADEGQAFVFQRANGQPCAQPPGKPTKSQADSCGNSWGNHVKVLHREGYFTFYVHLERILVKSGDVVKRGQPIGVEGWTGAAGHRHLHWSVQRLPGTSQKEWEERISWDGESVPFRFAAVVNGARQTVDASKIQCAHAGIGAAPSSQQPVLTAAGRAP